MPTEPAISVVVATFNRAPILARMLEHLVRQNLDPATFEIIVVNDGSSDNTEEVVSRAAAISPTRIHYLVHTNRGPGYTQNAGIRAARGQLILLLADDIFLTPNALAAHLSRHQYQPDSRVAVLGRAAPSPELIGTGFLNEWDAFGLDRFEHLHELPYVLFWAFNLSFKREFMIAHGMFREASGRGGPAAHEDTELGYRLHKHGMTLLYAKDALGYHHHPTTLDLAAARYHERGLNYGELLTNASDPMLRVFFRVPEFGSLGIYRQTVRDCVWLNGRDRRFAWHLFRHVARSLLFNGVTVPWIWHPLLRHDERCGIFAAAIPTQLYGPYLFYHFLTGIRDARRCFPPVGSTAHAL